MKMKAGCSQLKPVLLLFTLYLCVFGSCERTKPQICSMCSGPVLNDSPVGKFCSNSSGRVDGRCCLTQDNTTEPERIVGLDLSNCSLTHIEDLHEASTAIMIDLSYNPNVNLSDTVFQGFSDLNYLILPRDVVCPGGNTSWTKVELEEGTRLCEGQKNMCNQTGQMSMNCPENSLCAPYGPGFFECSCTENYHGYKCLREGEFPSLQVFGPLGVSTLVISFLLWVTQRRKAKAL